MPVYNGERYLAEALDSIVSQTYTDFELVISDNASTDATEEICRGYASRDERIRYHRGEVNRGAAWNYNRVFALSRGKYFKWASHDDRCAPAFLERCVAALDASPDVVVSYPRTTVIDARGGTIDMEEDDLQLDSRNVVRRFSNCLSPMKLCHNVIFGLMRRDVLAGTGLIGTYLASDRCLVAELSLYGPFEEISERLFFRRKHDANIGVDLEDLQFYRPGLSRRFVMPEWRLLGEFLKAVRRAPLTIGEKRRLAAAIFHWAAVSREEFEWQLKRAIKTLLVGHQRTAGFARYELNQEAERMRDLMNILPEGCSSALDIGARNGTVTSLLAEQCTEVTALDIVKPEIVHERVTNVHGDVTKLEFPDDSFDVVYCTELLEHIRPEMLERACAEIIRVARYVVVIGVPYRQDLRIGRTVCHSCGKKNPPWGHVNVFDEERLRRLFDSLEIAKMSFIGSNRDRTNAFSTALMDKGGNPWGTYRQREVCIHCGRKLVPPPRRTLIQRVSSSAALVMNDIQGFLSPRRPNWMHAVFRKRRFEESGRGE
jgi:glycosyltransferase involved in cell wall biosynthesis